MDRLVDLIGIAKDEREQPDGDCYVADVAEWAVAEIERLRRRKRGKRVGDIMRKMRAGKRQPLTREWFATVRPKMVERYCGGWLALTPDGAPLSIGVAADTEEEARTAFATALCKWESLLFDVALADAAIAHREGAE